MMYARMKKPTDWIPLVRHSCSHNTGLVFSLVDEVIAVVDALMKTSSRTEGEFGSPAALGAGHAAHILQSAQRLERRAQVRHQQLWLFPRREVPAFVELVVIDELGIRPLRPASRGLIELLRKGAHGSRDGDVFRSEKRQLALPIETRRRDRRVRQPIERDVVEDVVSR